MKKTGIWMDTKEALVMTINDMETDEVLERITSNVEDFHLHGGYGSKVKYNPQDATSETKLTERKKHQLNQFFDQIIERIKDSDAIAIFGAGETKIAFKKVLEEHYLLADKIATVETADSMTENQTKALIRDFYQNRGKS